MSAELTPARFVQKWARIELTERAASQEHFLDLCRLLGQRTPAETDATGEEYTFEKGVAVTDAASAGSRGDRGFADVWYRGRFAWEYKRKGKHKTLTDAYRQLSQYREALENPPLLIVSDIARTEIHTNFTGTRKEIHGIALADLTRPEKLDLLRRVFTDPNSFKPGLTSWQLTEQAAADFAQISDSLRQRNIDPHAAAHFLMKCMFCLFAEDVNLLPQRVFSTILKRTRGQPDRLAQRMTDLFRAMARGGDFGADEIPFFNGGLFKEDETALSLTNSEVNIMLVAAEHDWSAVEPSIFGTLFERSLDPGKRAQIGAHYTSRDDIMLIVEPVVMAPLRREWAAVQAEVEKLLARRRDAKTDATKRKANAAIEKALADFIQRLASVRILDPACGSGNFLYVAIQQLLSLEKEVIIYAAGPEIGLGLFPAVRPTQLHGIEINPYAAELAQVVIWIGYLQWMRENGFNVPRDPILSPLQSIENRDAILDFAIPTKPQPATWPEADFIIGNPPFLGGNLIRQGLGDDYVEALFDAYDLPKFSDYCCYWFEEARRALTERPALRVGLLATQAIRGGVNREVLTRVKHTGDIFMAWSDRNWVLEGAAVHVSMVGFDCGAEATKSLNGQPVKTINTDLTCGTNTAEAKAIPENAGLQHEGDKKGGAFELSYSRARGLIGNPGVAMDSVLTVLRPWFNGTEINNRLEGNWIIDFPPGTTMQDAAQFASAFEYVEKHVGAKYKKSRQSWWIHERPRPAMRAALRDLPRFVVTTRHSKHRLFSWIPSGYLPDSAVIVFPRPDDYFFGVLHSSVHELWALRMGTQLEDRPRYTPTTCFETFPLPWPPGKEPAPEDVAHGGAALQRIATAAAELNAQRERWLNPPEWIEALGRMIDKQDDFSDVPEAARPLLRHSAIMAAAAREARFKKRTLTNLYNERPTWLRLAHEALDRAVLAAYAATDAEGGWSEDWAEVWTETGAGQPLPDDHPLAARRKELSQQVVANLLRLNLARAIGQGASGPASGVKRL